MNVKTVLLPDEYSLTFEQSINPELLSAYGGSAHGDDSQGAWDLQFEDLRSAMSWMTACEANRWNVKPRDPITDFFSPVVIQVRCACTHPGCLAFFSPRLRKEGFTGWMWATGDSEKEDTTIHAHSD